MKDYSKQKRYQRESLLHAAKHPERSRSDNVVTTLAPRYQFDSEDAAALATFTTPKTYHTDSKTLIRYSEGVSRFADRCHATWLVNDMCYHAATLLTVYRRLIATYTVVGDDGFLSLYNTDEKCVAEVKYPNTHFTLQNECPLTFRFLYHYAEKCSVLVLPSEVTVASKRA